MKVRNMISYYNEAIKNIYISNAEDSAMEGDYATHEYLLDLVSSLNQVLVGIPIEDYDLNINDFCLKMSFPTYREEYKKLHNDYMELIMGLIQKILNIEEDKLRLISNNTDKLKESLSILSNNLNQYIK